MRPDFFGCEALDDSASALFEALGVAFTGVALGALVATALGALVATALGALVALVALGAGAALAAVLGALAALGAGASVFTDAALPLLMVEVGTVFKVSKDNV